MKIALYILLGIAVIVGVTAFKGVGSGGSNAGYEKPDSNFYNLSAKNIDDSLINFSSFKGKKVMIVNTASFCGYTPQFEQLQKLHEEYGDKLVLVGFPSNSFMQEAKEKEKTLEVCQKYDVSFMLMEKISVKGSNKHPVYEWLTNKQYNGVKDSKVKWNFQKYLIDEEGKFVDVVSTSELPNSERIINWIKTGNWKQ